VVVAAEESDWLLGEAIWMFDHEVVVAEGAGAVYLEPGDSGILLEAVTPSISCVGGTNRGKAAAMLRRDLEPWREGSVLFDGVGASSRLARAEREAWSDWRGERVSVKRVLGEAFSAGPAWQVVAAVDALHRGVCHRAVVPAVGSNEKCLGAVFSWEVPG
jgi:hypothetical protein